MKIPVVIVILLISLALIVGCTQEQAPVSAPVPPTSPTPTMNYCIGQALLAVGVTR